MLRLRVAKKYCNIVYFMRCCRKSVRDIIEQQKITNHFSMDNVAVQQDWFMDAYTEANSISATAVFHFLLDAPILDAALLSLNMYIGNDAYT